jgi:biotin operon repressor
MEPQKAEYVLRKALEKAVEELRPAGEGPSLVDLRDRPVRKKRKVRLPGAWAEYYIAKLLLAGHTLEAIAEQLELSPRQVHHYLDRLAIRLASSLEVKLREISL